MPVTISDYSTQDRGVSFGESYEYKYPGGLDLKPGSEFHDKLLAKIMRRADDSHSVMTHRHKTWRAINKTMNVFIRQDEDEKKQKAKDERRPTSVVIPISYAIRETILTHWVNAFLRDTHIFRYRGVGPEDSTSAILMEEIIALHCAKFKVALSLYTQWSDALTYGIGIASPTWETHRFKSVVKQVQPQKVMGVEVATNPKVGKVTKESKFSGNALTTVDPFSYLPDPNVSASEVQKSEFIGWVVRDNRMNILTREKNDPDSYFNCKFLKDTTGKSGESRLFANSSDRKEREGQSSTGNSSQPIDVLYMYITLVPKEWKLGEGEYPEKWLFAVAADKYIIQAEEVGLNHGQYPIAVVAPDFDGYSASPLSRMESVDGLQTVMNFLFNSHMDNVRKAVNDVLIVDPQRVNVNDLLDPKPGKIVRLTPSAWGQGVDNAVKQLTISDITRANIGDSNFVESMMRAATGATEPISGIRRQTSERVSATEAQSDVSISLSRISKDVRLASIMAMYDIGMQFASNTQQLLDDDVYVNIAGRMEQELLKTVGTNPNVKVDPMSILGPYDLVPYDNTISESASLDSWMTIFQIISQNPVMGQQFDGFRVFSHIARLMGVQNISDFQNKTPPNVQVLPDQQVQEGAASGALAPLPVPGV